MASPHRTALSDVDRWDAADSAARAKQQGPHGLAKHAADTGRPVTTARRWARVADRYPAKDRGLTGLTFSHYEAVASHPERMQLLREAADQGWSVSELRIHAAERAPINRDTKVLNPKVVDEAIDYVQHLANFGERGSPTLKRSLGPRLETLSDMAGTLASGWAEEEA